MKSQEITNWGNYPKIRSNVYSTEYVDEARSIIKKEGQITPRGNGRSYGDASLGENVISCLELDKILDFDKNSGIIKCQSGMLLSDILEFIVPKGFFLPVTPGTKFITVGGKRTKCEFCKEYVFVFGAGVFRIWFVFLDSPKRQE